MSAENTINGQGGSSSRKLCRPKIIDLENQEMLNYIEDLEKSLSLNKQVLSDLIMKYISEDDSGNIILQLLKEVQDSEIEYLRLVKECENNQVKALMDEQIATEYLRKEQEFIMESEEKVADIIYQNDKKSKIISELSLRIRQLEEDSELYKKSRNMIVVPPTEDIMDLHCQVEELKSALSYEARNLYSLQSKKEKLLENSHAINKEVEKIKILLKNPLNRKYGLEHSSVIVKNDLSMEIIQGEESEEDSDELQIVPIGNAPVKSSSQPLFELSLNNQYTLSFDMLGISSKENEGDENVLLDINEHIDALKMEMLKITEELVKVSQENEILLESNEKMARNYLKNHEFIEVSQAVERPANAKSKNSRSNSNVNEEVFKYIDIHQLNPKII